MSSFASTLRWSSARTQESLSAYLRNHSGLQLRLSDLESEAADGKGKLSQEEVDKIVASVRDECGE